MKQNHGAGSAVYGLGLIGALFYNMRLVTDVSSFLLGLVKSIFWPAFVVYKIFEFLKI